MSNNSTPRLALPMLQPGQAQKELYHNEALVLLDMAVQPNVAGIGLNTPPASPTPGSCWIVGAVPTGAWAGAAHQVAGWTDGGWRFILPVEGMTVWSTAAALEARFAAGFWTIGETRSAQLMIGGVQVVGARQPAIVAPGGGAVIDTEARGVLALILAALAAHGLVAG